MIPLLLVSIFVAMNLDEEGIVILTDFAYTQEITGGLFERRSGILCLSRSFKKRWFFHLMFIAMLPFTFDSLTLFHLLSHSFVLHPTNVR
jgi:hypothetical protein